MIHLIICILFWEWFTQDFCCLFVSPEALLSLPPLPFCHPCVLFSERGAAPQGWNAFHWWAGLEDAWGYVPEVQCELLQRAGAQTFTSHMAPNPAAQGCPLASYRHQQQEAAGEGKKKRADPPRAVRPRDYSVVHCTLIQPHTIINTPKPASYLSAGTSRVKTSCWRTT